MRVCVITDNADLIVICSSKAVAIESIKLTYEGIGEIVSQVETPDHLVIKARVTKGLKFSKSYFLVERDINETPINVG